jgi:DNA-binding transcriptional MerR regulator
LTLEPVPAFTIHGEIGVTVVKSSFRSGELAELAGVSTDTLRHYERKGVLVRPSRKVNGYRQYPAAALQRVRLIRRALAVGFTLDELATVLKVRDHGGAPCAEVRTLAVAKLSEVETRLRETTALRNELRSVLRDWDARLAYRALGEPALLLESLANDGNGKASNRRRRVPQIHLTRKKKETKSK